MTDRNLTYGDLATNRWGGPMTYAQAKLRIWNPRAYTRQEVIAGAIFVLGSLSARREDIDAATGLL
jgi:hypothetical protein